MTRWTPPDKPADRPTVPEVEPLVLAWKEKLQRCGCLHITLDDSNIDDSSVAFCLELAQQRGHEDCERLARLLLQMTTTQRRRLA